MDAALGPAVGSGPSSSRQPPTIRQLLLFLAMSAIWGSSYFWTKIALRSFDPTAIVMLRMGIATLVLGAAILVSKIRLPRHGAAYRNLVLLSAVNVALPYTMITWAQQYVSASLTAILSSTTPLFVFAIATLILKDEGFTWQRQCGTIVAFSGVFYLFAGGLIAHGQRSSLIGELVIIASSLVFAIGNVLGRHTTRNIEPLVAAFLQSGFGCAFVVPLTLFSGRSLFGPAELSSRLAVLWLGVMGTAVTYLLYFYLLRVWGSTRTSMNTYLQPIVGVTLGVTVLGDSLSGRVAIAVVITGAGVVTFALGSRGGSI